VAATEQLPAGEVPAVRVRVIRVPTRVIETIGDHRAAIVYGQVRWLLSKHQTHAPDPGRGLYGRWRAETRQSLAQQTGLTEHQVERALDRLRRSGLIGARQAIFWGGGPLHTRTCLHLWLPKDSPAPGQEHTRLWLPWTLRATGGRLNAALVLGYIWFRIHHDQGLGSAATGPPIPDPELAETAVVAPQEQIADWTLLSSRQVKGAVAALHDLSLIETRRTRSGTRYRLAYWRCVGMVLLSAGWTPAGQEAA
jgi:hypothetical protein